MLRQDIPVKSQQTDLDISSWSALHGRGNKPKNGGRDESQCHLRQENALFDSEVLCEQWLYTIQHNELIFVRQHVHEQSADWTSRPLKRGKGCLEGLYEGSGKHKTQQREIFL